MRQPLHLTRILRRRERAALAGGRLLARRLAERRRPKLLGASVRLARQQRSGVGPVRQTMHVPEGLSEFAARWLFGDGQVEGVPFAGAATMGSVGDRPSFLDPPERPADAPAPPVMARTPAPSRGRIEEGPAFRVSAQPPPGPSAAQPEPTVSGEEPEPMAVHAPPPAAPEPPPADVPDVAMPAAASEASAPTAQPPGLPAEPVRRSEPRRPAAVLRATRRTAAKQPPRSRLARLQRTAPVEAPEPAVPKQESPASAEAPASLPRRVWRAVASLPRRIAASPPEAPPAQSHGTEPVPAPTAQVLRQARISSPASHPEEPLATGEPEPVDVVEERTAPEAPADDEPFPMPTTPHETQARPPAPEVVAAPAPSQLLIARGPAARTAAPAQTQARRAVARREAAHAPPVMRIARAVRPAPPPPPARLPSIWDAPAFPRAAPSPPAAAEPDIVIPVGSPRVVMRAAAASGPAAGSMHSAVSSAPPPAPPPTRAGETSTPDAVYEEIVDRLRRDLMAERERMGDLLGDLP